MSSLRAPRQNGPYNVLIPTHRTTQKHVEHIYATDIYKKQTIFVFFGFLLSFLFLFFLNDFSNKMLSYRLGTVNFH